MTSFFRSRRAVTLVRPLHDERRLQQVDAVPFAQLRPEFKADFKVLQQALFKDVQPKRLAPFGKGAKGGGGSGGAGRAMTGPMYASLVASYAAAVSAEGGGGMPVIASAWETVASAESDAAAAAAVAAHGAILTDLLSQAGGGRDGEGPGCVDEGAGAACHAAAYAASLASFDARAEGPRASGCRLRAEAAMAEAFVSWLSANRAASSAHCRALLAKLYAASTLATLEAAPAPAGAGGAGGDDAPSAASSGGAVEEDPLGDPSRAPAHLLRLFSELEQAYRAGVGPLAARAHGDCHGGTGTGGGAGGSASVAEARKAVGPSADDELLALLGAKWPLFLRRCCAALAVAGEHEQAALDGRLEAAQRAAVNAASRNEAAAAASASSGAEAAQLRVEVARLSAAAEGAKARAAALEAQATSGVGTASELRLAADEANERAGQLEADLRAKEAERLRAEREIEHLQARLDAVPPYEPPKAGCCAVQ